MILVDTSVWIDFFNAGTSVHARTLDAALEEGTVMMGDLILLEILQGFRNDREYRLVKSRMSVLTCFNLPGQGMIEQCAGNYRYLRKRGITIRKTADVIIASFCIENKIPLLFKDKDFNPFVKHLGLASVTLLPG